MGEQGIKRLITVFAEAMSRVASRQSRVSQAIGDDTKADGAMKNPISVLSSYSTAVYHFLFGKRFILCLFYAKNSIIVNIS